MGRPVIGCPVRIFIRARGGPARSAYASVSGNGTTYPYATGLRGVTWTGTTPIYYRGSAPARRQKAIFR